MKSQRVSYCKVSILQTMASDKPAHKDRTIGHPTAIAHIRQDNPISVRFRSASPRTAHAPGCRPYLRRYLHYGKGTDKGATPVA